MTYDEAFTVEQSRIGTWRSFDVDGKPLVTSPTEASCIDSTRFYLKTLQDGFTESGKKYDGVVVGGKL
jgi:hypothetical protein